MRYLSVCSGIEAASVAWHHLGWEPVGFSEIEPFPAAVLKHRFPHVPNYGDMTKFEEWPIEPGTVDLLVGGTPCQSFSVAGLRKGLEDPRGNLMLTYLAIAARLKPRWVVWENVPGVLSSNGGRDFGTFLGALGELGYGWAYRVLDAQYVRVGRWPRAVPQRRRRVFVVGRLIERGAGDWTAAAQAVLIPEGLRRHNQASPKARKVAPSDAEGGARGGFYGGSQPDCADTVTSKWSKGSGGPAGNECGLFLAQPTGWPADCAGTLAQSSTGSGAPGYSNQEIFSQNCANLVPQPVPIQDGREIEKRQNGLGIWQPGDPAYTVNTTEAQAVAFAQNQREEVREVEVPGALAAEPGTHQQTYIAQPVPFTKAKRAQSVTDDETWVQGQVNPTLSLFDQGDTRATTVAVAHAFYSTDGTHGVNQHPEVSPAVKVGSGLGIPSPPAVAQAMTVRRLTPVECERLQGFPDDWTLIPWRGKPAEQCPDGPRYKALGNSMACNCMAWIGEQIAKWEADHA